MTNFLEEAMEQEELREMTENLVEEVAGAIPPKDRPVWKEGDDRPRSERAFGGRVVSALKQGSEELGGHSLRPKNDPPDSPKKSQRGDFDFFPRDFPVKRSKGRIQRARAEDPVVAVLRESRMSQPAGVRNRGAERLGVLAERLRGARDEGQEPDVPGAIRSVELPLLAAVKRAGESLAFVRGQRRNFAVTVPESAGGGEGGLTVDALDRAVERDARRYDGGTMLY